MISSIIDVLNHLALESLASKLSQKCSTLIYWENAKSDAPGTGNANEFEALPSSNGRQQRISCMAHEPWDTSEGEYAVIEDPVLAGKVHEKLTAARSLLARSVSDIKGRCPDEEYAKYRLQIAQVLTMLIAEIIIPIEDKHQWLQTENKN